MCDPLVTHSSHVPPLFLLPPLQVPIQRNLIQVDLLSDAELAWLNAYHAETRAKLVDRVEGRAKEWLLRETETIARQ